MRKANETLVAKLVETARKILNHDAGNDEPEDIWEIDILTKAFTKVLEEKVK
jgi:hypothetical protein